MTAVPSLSTTNPLPIPAPSSVITFRRTINRAANYAEEESDGLTSKQIRLIQTGLSELGYDPGPVEGKIGQKTNNAIRDFQRDRSMPPTGQVSGELLAELKKVTGLTSLSDS